MPEKESFFASAQIFLKGAKEIRLSISVTSGESSLVRKQFGRKTFG
jgi:hypothetical protein